MTRQEKLMELADRIDHEKLWQRPAMTEDQRDRLDAGVMVLLPLDALSNARMLRVHAALSNAVGQAAPEAPTGGYADPTLACSSCGLTMGESRTLGHIKLGILATTGSASGDACPICTEGRLLQAHVCNTCETVVGTAEDARANLCAPAPSQEAAQAAHAGAPLVEAVRAALSEANRGTSGRLILERSTEEALRAAIAASTKGNP